MAAEPYSAAGETSGPGEPLVSTTLHWGTAQLGAPPREQPAPMPQTAEPGTRPATDPAVDHPTGHTTAPTGHVTAHPGPITGPPAGVVLPERPTHEPDRPPTDPDRPPQEPDRPPNAPAERPAEQAAPTPADVAEGATEVDADDDAVVELIRVAVVSRPLDDVVDLVTRLEQSPEERATARSVLRLAAVARSVEDVTRLVELLGPPEYPADHMDEAIRHAAEERPIPEVSRLVQLLSRPPHDPHSGAEVVHAAGTARSVEDLMELMDSLRDHTGDGSATHPINLAALTRRTPAEADASAAPGTPGAQPAGAGQPSPAMATAAATPRRARERTPVTWLRRVAGVLFLLCAAAHVPMDWSHTPTVGLSVAVGVAAVCAVAGVALLLSGSPFVAVAATLVAGALTVGHLVDDRVNSKTLGYVLRPDGVAPPLPALSAMVATLAALLVVALTVAGLRASANRTPTQAPRR
ncbi:hypothetical protein AB0C93_17165 [Streptomyces sp. NPDC048518]|uniref:hypothetical protein n=1 Tax=Streptomyces sp. NPDC048518 TaxID=3155029 RepID=UPI0033D330A7